MSLFPHSGSVPCRCPYKERIIRQTTVARTPNHQFVDGCCPALPPRLWQPRNPEGGEATVIYVEGSLKFPNSYRVSQLDAVIHHIQDYLSTNNQISPMQFCCNTSFTLPKQSQRSRFVVVVVALLFYLHGQHLRSCRDGQLT